MIIYILMCGDDPVRLYHNKGRAERDRDELAARHTRDTFHISEIEVHTAPPDEVQQ